MNDPTDKAAIGTAWIIAVLMCLFNATNERAPNAIPESEVVQSTATPAVQVDDDASTTAPTSDAEPPTTAISDEAALAVVSYDDDDPCGKWKDFCIAVGGNGMGWFCERYGYGELEMQVASRPDSSQLLLYRAVAKKMVGLEPLAVSLPESAASDTGMVRTDYVSTPAEENETVVMVPTFNSWVRQPVSLAMPSANCANGQRFAPSRGCQYQRRRAAILPWRR